MKRFMSFALSLILIFVMLPTAFAAETVTPTPPSWVDADEYAVLPDGVAYQEENWEKILKLRADAEKGNLAPEKGDELYDLYYNPGTAFENGKNAPSVDFELTLISAKYASNANKQGISQSMQSCETSAYTLKKDYPEHPGVPIIYLWNARSFLWNMKMSDDYQDQQFFYGALALALKYPQFTVDQMLDNEFMRQLPQEKMAFVKNLLVVTLDGEKVHPSRIYYKSGREDSYAHARYGRTMVPLRRLAELVGATVEYENATKRITITRATDEIVMTIDSKQAYRNGEAFEMDVAPYVENGRTYVPVRYIAEFFGQKVEWLPERREVRITENKEAVAPSNLESWALGMGAVLSYMNHAEEETLFGGKKRFGANPVGSAVNNRLETTGPDFAKQSFENGWAITDRASLLETVSWLLAEGHNAAFMETARTDCPELYQKWGGKGILCWDMFRISSLVQWGYLAGYITYPEALALLEPAAQTVRNNFSSWDEAYENYLDGYSWWSGTYTSGVNTWDTERGTYYQELKKLPRTAALFDDSLFKTPVIGVPNLTAEQLLSAVD